MKKSGLILIGIAFVLIVLLVPRISREKLQQRNENPVAQSDSENTSSSALTKPQRQRATVEYSLALEEESRRQLQEQILSLLATENPVDINKVYNELLPSLTEMDPRAA